MTYSSGLFLKNHYISPWRIWTWGFLSNWLQLLSASCDVDWDGCPYTHCFTTGWCVYLSNALISWKCEKQDHVFKLSTEAEYGSMSSMSFAYADIANLRGYSKNLNFHFPLQDATPHHANNTSAIQIASQSSLSWEKHMIVDCYYIREAFF